MDNKATCPMYCMYSLVVYLNVLLTQSTLLINLCVPTANDNLSFISSLMFRLGDRLEKLRREVDFVNICVSFIYF